MHLIHRPGLRTHKGRRTWLLNAVLGGFLMAALGLTACASAPEEAILGPTHLINEVKFKGAERFSRNQLLKHIHAGETSWVPFSPDYHFNEALLAVDATRIEALYESYGYYQAEVTDIQVIPNDEDQEVDLLVTIDEGEPTLMRKVDFEWLQSQDVDQNTREEIQALASLTVDGPFEVTRLNDSIGTMRLDLQRRGYPMAKVSALVDVVEGARTADASFTISAGPSATIGEISFQGLYKVPEYMIEREIRFAKGKPYSPAMAKQVENAVKAMQVFRWVTVQLAPQVVDGTIDLTVRVSEADPQSIRIGAEASFETVRWQEQLNARYTHTNLFGHLTRLDLDLIAGWAQLPSGFDPDVHGPVLKISPKFRKKGILEEYLVWTLNPAFSVNIQEGYQFYSPSNRVGVSRWFNGNIQTSLSHTTRFVDFFNIDPSFDSSSTQLGRDFRDPFLLSFLELKTNIYLVDSIREPNDGFIFELAYNLAGGVFAGDYDFQKFLGSVRSYWRPWQSFQIAARLQSGLILPYGNEPGAPFNFKFYLGGADTVRGWGSRRLSPQLFECGDPNNCRGIPIGGFTMIQGNLELRLDVGGGFALIAFADMGDVQANEKTFKPEEWNYSAGPGLRFDSPIGLFRLDFGFRLNETGVYPNEPGWSLYFGIGETF